MGPIGTVFVHGSPGALEGAVGGCDGNIQQTGDLVGFPPEHIPQYEDGALEGQGDTFACVIARFRAGNLGAEIFVGERLEPNRVKHRQGQRVLGIRRRVKGSG